MPDDVRIANITVTAQLIAKDFATVGAQECPEEAWRGLEADLEPHGFWWESGKLYIPGDLCDWWRATLAGRKATWPRTE